MSLPNYRLQSTFSAYINGQRLVFESVFLGTKFTVSLPSQFSSKLEAIISFLNSSQKFTKADFEELFGYSQFGDALFKINVEREIFVPARLTDSLSPSNSRWDRQIRFWNSLETTEWSGDEINSKLQATHVLLIGAGGFGSWIAEYLGLIGIRKLTVFDPDNVEKSNLGRCAAFQEADIGKNKAETLKHYFDRRYPTTKVEAVNSLFNPQLTDLSDPPDFCFAPFGLVRAAGDNKNILLEIDDFCKKNSIPYIVLGANSVGPLWRQNGDPDVIDALDKTKRGFEENPRSLFNIAKRQFGPIIAGTCAKAVTEFALFTARNISVDSVGNVIVFDFLQPTNSTAISVRKPDEVTTFEK